MSSSGCDAQPLIRSEHSVTLSADPKYYNFILTLFTFYALILKFTKKTPKI
ncbi:hypothetical protein VCHA50P420_160078 [Vibrio chagasii]|nr:hypothetical protein VCHA50P420_160078 [Vibrio chagasii]